jgi:DNA-binding protein HU-beta
MDYTTLVAKVAERSGISRAKAGSVCTALRAVILETLADDEVVKFAGLGTFKVITRKETHRRDPLTREMRAIPARRKPKLDFSALAEEEVL